MTLECTLVSGPEAVTSYAPEELSIAVSVGTPGALLQSILKQERGTGSLTVDGQDLSRLTVGTPPLVSGAVMVDGRGPLRQPAEISLPLMLQTHSGPGAGSVFRLHRGRFRIGRGQADVSIPDPGMSREHAFLDVSSSALTLSGADAANPVFVDGLPTRRRSVSSESTIACGSSTFSVATERGPLPEISNDAGRSVEEPLEVPHAGRQGNRVAIILTAGLPLVAGVGLAIATGMWMYLGFTAISAVSLLIPFITGRKSRRECRVAVARAAAEDRVRRRHSAPSAAELVMAVLGSSGTVAGCAPQPVVGPAVVLPSRSLAGSSAESGGESPRIWIRIGIAEAVANVRLAPDDPLFRPPAIGAAAVTLDPRPTTVSLDGPPDHVDAVIRFMVMQIAGFPLAAGSPVILLGSSGRLPISARFLPHVVLSTSPEAALSALRHLNASLKGRLIVIDHPVDGNTGALPQLLSAARTEGWQVVHCGPSPRHPGCQIEISQSGTKGHLELAGERRAFVPDLVPMNVFDAFCRQMALRAGAGRSRLAHAVPEQSALADLLSFGTRRILLSWEKNAQTDGLTALLGVGCEAELTFDFQLDGPHLLVAGTTGAGKSELLRTLVASIALKYSPDHTTFLFFDFKGGSGLRPLAGLPHCVGLLTDLGGHHLDRTLASLRGEIRYREEMFAAADVTDLVQYHRADSGPRPSIPHLVLVIDEFRMLIDEAPGAIRELMRVATIGRSLGIHLVMATQRPQGALTADIRANVTSSIALRVQSEAESVDIINSKEAASIRADTPGRAYLARASGKPEEFQTASLAVPPVAMASPGPGDAAPQLVKAAERALAGHQLLHPSGAPSTAKLQEERSDAGVQQLVSTIKDAWGRLGRPLPRHPVAAPLPSLIPWSEELPASAEDCTDAAGTPAAQWHVGPLALVDIPARQCVKPLRWLPAEHGHLAMIGSASSGMHACFRAVSAMLATHGPQPHSYVLDGAGILGDLNGQRRVGAVAGLYDLPLAALVLRRMAEEMDRRRIVSEVERTRMPLALIVTGWCSWATAFRNGPMAWAEAIMQDIARDGRSLGITVLICGERELVSSRFFAAIQNRAYFPHGSTEESRFHWPRLPEVEGISGRAFATGNFVEGRTAVTQFREAPDAGQWPFADLPPGESPFRVRPLPDRLSEEDFREAHVAFGVQQKRGGKDPGNLLWIGVGGDEADPVSLPLRSNGVSLILGSPRSGKSSILASLRRLNPSVPWVYPPAGTPAGTFWSLTGHEATQGILDPGSILLVDDADSLDVPDRQALGALLGKVRGIVITATPGPALVHHLPLARDIQTLRMGLVLAPQTPHDADLLGVRLEVDRAPRAGRGYIVDAGDVKPFHAVLTSGPSPQAVPDGSG
ncbi:S-DNA-T family DNA segregation ATPase FtsK/SpoIIIE [Paenarthrobacter sp. TE4293]|uniref:FtsK/SpoIIIE domain-containing protein n=1 Tax=Paenarthrobacter sp. TE4293 TaxID=3381695 RepID=UPI003D1EA486